MVIVFEISRPIQSHPGISNTNLSIRVWWLCFALAWWKIGYKDMMTRELYWKQ